MEGNNVVKISSWLLLFTLTLIWGSSFILIKRGLMTAEGDFVFSPFQLGSLRIVLAGLSLMPILFLNLKKVKRKDHFWLLMVGLVGNTIPAFLFAYAETKVPSSIAGMLNSTTPIFVVLIALFVFKKRFSKINIMGIVLGSIGALGLVYFGGEADFHIDGHRLLLILATICYGASVNMIKMKLKGVTPVTITAISLGFMAFPCLGYLLSTDFWEVMTTNPHASTAFMYVAILSVLGTTVALVLFNYLVKSESILFASSVTYLIPIVAIFWGLRDGEVIATQQLLMIVVILAGVFLVNLKDKKALITEKLVNKM